MSQADRKSSFLRYITHVVLLAIVYVGAARLGFLLSFVEGNVWEYQSGVTPPPPDEEANG